MIVQIVIATAIEASNSFFFALCCVGESVNKELKEVKPQKQNRSYESLAGFFK